MSCQLNLLSKIKDLSTLKQFISPNTADKENSDTVETSAGWNEDWGWDDTAEDAASSDETDQTDNVGNDDWLSECEVSISSLGELIAVCKGDRVAVLQINYEGGDGGMFGILWKGIVTEYTREAVTCVYCLPLISNKRSSQGAPEWTCIILGFNTGYVRMYTETGTKVLDQMLHNESVMCIKCKTYSPPRYPTSSDLTEELTVLYETVLVALDGFGLYQTLRACKNRAAMAAASGSSERELPSLGYKKWGLKGQGQASEHVSGGYYIPNPFDQMQTASLAGFNEKISAIPPTSCVYSCVGDNPFVGVYHAMDGESYHLFNNVTEAATKLLSVGAKKLYSWGASYFRKSEIPPETEKAQTRVEPATPAFHRFSLYDKRRIGQSMSLSPAGTIAAVTDSLGRVLLIDTSKGVITRIWKGYRQAQIGWMTVKERSSSSHTYRRNAFFLIIYAPKRGLLEIWLSRGGSRVGAFNVGKGCRLIYPGCSILGINSSTYKHAKGKVFQCFLLKPNGDLMDISIPFHLALSDANSKRAHDQQLMSLLKTALRAEGDNPQHTVDDLWEPISKMKLTISLQHALERVLSSSHLTASTALTIINNITKMVKRHSPQQQRDTADLDVDDDILDQSMNVEGRLLLELCDSLKLLVEMHSRLKSWCDTDAEPKVVDLSLLAPVEDVASLLQTIVHVKPDRKVGFSTDSQLNLCDFISLFDTQRGPKLHQLSDDQMVSLGRIMFEPCLKYKVNFEEVKEVTSPLKLSPRFLLDVLLCYYLNLRSPSNSQLVRLESIIYSIYSLYNQLEDEELSTVAEESMAIQEPTTPELDMMTPDLSFNQSIAPFPRTHRVPWWLHIRAECEASTNLESYLHIAIACRSICIKVTAELTNEFPDPAGDFEKVPGAVEPNQETWEHLSVDVAMWNQSIKHLEDVSVLNRLLKHRVSTSPLPNKEIHSSIVTVKDIKTGNRGFIGELVGRWCVANLLPPAEHVKYETVPLSSATPSTPSAAADSDGSTPSIVDKMEPYRELTKAFPLSLTSDIIFANACLESVSQWNKEMDSMFLLKFALEYLLNIENSCLKHGLCLMIWNTYILKRVGSLVSLIEKVGKAPKDRLCKKEIDMDTAKTTEFMNAVCDYMEIFLQSNCDFSEPMQYKEEPSWAADVTTGHSLAQMACQQRETNYRLVKHHSNLLTIVTAVLTFNMKSVKIMSLFDYNGKAALFKSLNSHPFMSVEGKDALVVSHRNDFLCRVLLCAVQNLPPRANMLAPGGQITIDKTSDAMRWPVIVMSLAESFELETDLLRKYYISQLVSYGYDLLALEVLPFMSNPTPAYVAILELCSQRVSYYMLQSDQTQLTAITCAMTPALSNWLKEKAAVTKTDSTQYFGNLVANDVTMTETNTLLLRVVNGLHSSPKHLRFAQELYSLTTDLN